MRFLAVLLLGLSLSAMAQKLPIFLALLRKAGVRRALISSSGDDGQPPTARAPTRPPGSATSR